MPITFVTVQYSARPLGTVSVNQANMSGIIHSSMVLVCCCWGLISTPGWFIDSLVCSQVVAATSPNMM